MSLPAITFSKDSLSHFSDVITKEWILTNGLGGYASQTVPGLNTRKYHGLLVAALQPPGQRTVILSKLDEDIIVGADTHRLGSNEFHDTIYPDGYKLIEYFTLNPFPIYKYTAGNVEITKTIFMPNNKNAIIVIYNLQNFNSRDIKIHLYPILTCRYYHNVIDRHQTPLNFTQENASKELAVSFSHPHATATCRISDGIFKTQPNWVDHLTYREDDSRGEANVDDCFQPGFFEVEVPSESKKIFAVSCADALEAKMAKQILDDVGGSFNQINQSFFKEKTRQESIVANFYLRNPTVPMTDWLNWILLAADSFIVQSGTGGKAIIAGYHWFETWGRDTFISLPGLLLTTGRYHDAKHVLQDFNDYLNDGLIPNYIADKTGAPTYQTVDATLWYINAVIQYVKYTADYAFVKNELWSNLQSIVKSHQNGTKFDIKLDEDGLLSHGPRLTWMDAMVEKDIVTPRSGKAVEIQALWYNTLRTMEHFAKEFNEKKLADNYLMMANRTAESFNEKFWNQKLDCLFDVLEPTGGLDASMRPNQVFAVSLEFTMLKQEKSRKVVDALNRDLVTPYGLRTLSLDDPKFVGKCVGDRRSRDTAYHNGTIWPWLLGPYITAYLKVNEYSQQAKKYALENLVVPLLSVAIHQGGLGTVNEIYDCDPPNDPRGCISQAWSIGEPLRAYIEDVLGVKPKNL
ncbi:MAG: amylo-alpha-1,6-glucosidase [Betaproteobacteria bacterium]